MKNFTETTLSKCQSVVKIRQENNLVSSDIVVPTKINEFQKYHTDCYRRFTALSPNYRVSASNPTVEMPSTSRYVFYQLFLLYKNK